MRADVLGKLLSNSNFHIIDTNQPFNSTSRLIRSIGFRYKLGPLIRRLNKYIVDSLPEENQEIIWVDKAVFITEKTTQLLRSKTKKLIHFTPDPAFAFHRSMHFFHSVKYYDFLVTTKSYELLEYLNHSAADKIILTTQGFNHELHTSSIDFSDKKPGVIFIGHFERERGEICQSILEAGINLTIAGRGWSKFSKKNADNSWYEYLGKGVYSDKYAYALSSYQFSLGFLSKWIPEKHTTRTFEIPACGTALLTERNEETSSFFTEEEAIFYDSTTDLIQKIKYHQDNIDKLRVLTEKGRAKVIERGFDYHSIIKGLLKQIYANTGK